MNPIKHFLMAVQFYSRLPVPFKLKWTEEGLNKATAYFPLVGVFLAAHLCVVYYLTQMVFSSSLALLITLVISMLMTGGFHEDGLADYCDGIGGGWTRTQKLEIMKDSRVGTFGVLGLLSVFLIKWQALLSIPSSYQYWAIFIGMTWSRWGSMLVMVTLPYLREERTSKPIATGLTLGQFLLGSMFAWLLLIPVGYKELLAMIMGIPVLLIGTLFMRWHMKSKLGGYTGDSLGATQQIAEAVYYLGVIAVFKFF